MQYTERYEVRRKRKGEEPTVEEVEGPEVWKAVEKSLGPGESVFLVRVSEVIIGSGSRA